MPVQQNIRKRAARAIVVLLLLAAPATRAQEQSMASAQALERWIGAVAHHQPGRPDAAAALVAGYTYADRVRLNPAMQLFTSAMRAAGLRARPDSPAQQLIVNLFASLRVNPGLDAFVRRAAILHTDAAIFASRFPDPPDDAPASSSPAPGRRADLLLPPLLSHERFLMHRDGRVIGEMRADWNWPFARSLVDLLVRTRDSGPVEPDPAFVGAWYHAVAAYLFASGDLADLRAHLAHSERLPDDAHVLFDRACFAETLGLSYNQALRDDPDFVEAQRRSKLDLPGEDRTDGEAEKLFLRALDLDPSLAEARVRLARLLARRGRYEDASVELALAQASGPSRVVGFYAHLVAGRVAQAQGRFADSLDHYETAAKLFPDAQSALVGASQAAVMAADVPRGLTIVQKLGPRSGLDSADPWRDYRIGAGRDVNALMAALWARAR